MSCHGPGTSLSSQLPHGPPGERWCPLPSPLAVATRLLQWGRREPTPPLVMPTLVKSSGPFPGSPQTDACRQTSCKRLIFLHYFLIYKTGGQDGQGHLCNKPGRAFRFSLRGVATIYNVCTASSTWSFPKQNRPLNFIAFPFTLPRGSPTKEQSDHN